MSKKKAKPGILERLDRIEKTLKHKHQCLYCGFGHDVDGELFGQVGGMLLKHLRAKVSPDKPEWEKTLRKQKAIYNYLSGKTTKRPEGIDKILGIKSDKPEPEYACTRCDKPLSKENHLCRKCFFTPDPTPPDKPECNCLEMAPGIQRKGNEGRHVNCPIHGKNRRYINLWKTEGGVTKPFRFYLTPDPIPPIPATPIESVENDSAPPLHVRVAKALGKPVSVGGHGKYRLLSAEGGALCGLVPRYDESVELAMGAFWESGGCSICLYGSGFRLQWKDGSSWRIKELAATAICEAIVKHSEGTK